MADRKPKRAPVASGPATSGALIKKHLNGATFLTLEHTAYMVLVVVVPGLLALGLIAAINMWTGAQTSLDNMMGFGGLLNNSMQYLTAVWAIGLVAALLVLVPLMIVLEKRTRAEWQRRPGYSARLAYKAPVYTALGVLAALVVIATVCMVTVVIKSLMFLGVNNADIAGMYRNEFVPAFVALAAFKAASWYVILLALGRDYSKTFNSGVAALAAALVLALLVTSATVVNDTSSAQPLLPQNDTSYPFDQMRPDIMMPETDRPYRY
jgi:hypothetical protein